MSAADRAAVEAARKRREEEERIAVSQRQTSAAELVAEHYNAVPQRGRDWRKTESTIKGLRSLNNWVKSTLIQKFSRPENMIPGQGLCVLDMACGKGGDLGKWEKAPSVPALYVGCDIADISITQAQDRWKENRRKRMDVRFYVQDTFAHSLANIPIIRQVGFNPNAGPGSGMIQPGMMSGGFDVVSMMFALHYSYQTEELARGMLKNVAGALKKGGRFIGVMPNSDVISATVKRLLMAESAEKGRAPNGKSAEKDGGEEGEVEEEDGWDPEKPSEPQPQSNGAPAEEDGEDEWDPEKPSDAPPPSALVNGESATQEDGEADGWDPEKPSEPTPPTTTTQTNGTYTPAAPQPSSTPAAAEVDHHLPPLEWGNSLYKVVFHRHQPLTQRPLPRDGIFRPPYGWKYMYHLTEAVDAAEYVVPWEGFRALAEEYGLELLYRKGFKEVLDEVMIGEGREDKDLGMLAERMGVLSRDRSQGVNGLLTTNEEMEAAGFYHAFCFYKT